MRNSWGEGCKEAFGRVVQVLVWFKINYGALVSDDQGGNGPS